MIGLEAFFPYVLPFAHACPDPMAEQYLRVAATEFCRRTRIWREVDSFRTDGHPVDVLCVPPGASLFEIEKAWFEGQELRPEPFSRSWRGNPHHEEHHAEHPPRHDDGNPVAITQIAPNMIQLVSPGRGMFRVSMFLVPAPEADTVPDFLFDQFSEDIAAGALAHILLLPDQPWTNPQLAAVKRSEFSAALDRNFSANIRGQHRAPARTRSRFL